MGKHDRRETSGQPPDSRPVTIQVPLPVLGVVHGVREAFHGLCIATGLQVLEAMMEADRAVLCGPKGRHQVERPAWRGGSVESPVTLGGRQVEVPRLRVRSADGEVPLVSFQWAAVTDPLNEHTLAAVAAGVSTRRYAGTLDIRRLRGILKRLGPTAEPLQDGSCVLARIHLKTCHRERPAPRPRRAPRPVGSTRPNGVDWVDEPAPGYPRRPVPRDEDAAKELRKRTLTNPLQRPPTVARRRARGTRCRRRGRPRLAGRHHRRRRPARAAGTQPRLVKRTVLRLLCHFLHHRCRINGTTPLRELLVLNGG